MSPRAALQSPVFLFYAAVVFGLLLVAGVLLGVLRKKMGQAWRAYCGWLWMVPIAAVAVFLGREAAIVFFTGVGLVGFLEFAQATGLSGDRHMTGAVSLGIVATGAVALVPDWYELFMTLPLFAVAFLLIIPILRNRVHGQLRSLSLGIVGFLLFGWMFGHVALITNTKDAYAYLIYLLFAVEVNDIAAFLTGKMFGRHALRSNISPKKTWEGALGALAVSLPLPWALWFTFPHLQPQDLLMIGMIVGIGGQLGDLALSVIKRDLGVKDMGSTIPGHGGILDRIDSLIYVAPLFFHYLRYRHHLSPLP
jgi:phosphatidate cytidylyltransferase